MLNRLSARVCVVIIPRYPNIGLTPPVLGSRHGMSVANGPAVLAAMSSRKKIDLVVDFLLVPVSLTSARVFYPCRPLLNER